jgi:hypothetical protein
MPATVALRGGLTMFEIVVTYRPDFVEHSLERFPTLEEAQAVAQRLMIEHRDRIVRVWVRQIREAKTQK